MSGLGRRRSAEAVVKILEKGIGASRLESILYRLCRKPTLRRIMKLGSLAYAYAANLNGAPSRLAKLENYSLNVHLKSPWGVRSYFFGECGAFTILDRLLEPGCTFIDAGANIGQFSARATSLLHGNGRVFAFEPDPINHKLLVKTIEDNNWYKQLQVSNKALWKQSGDTLKFYLSQSTENTGTSSLVQHGVNQDKSQFIDVNTLSLDDFLKDEEIRKVRLIKIDVERAEYELLQGFREGLAGQIADFILIEMDGEGPCSHFLNQSGYEGFRVDNGMSIRDMDRNTAQVQDYLFVAPGLSKMIREHPMYDSVKAR